ncbi:MAG: DNRLRE domain-containing protein [Desulfobacteraceae bacterium]|nr:DNRLRE domain-containing protein [Desulfobacteraceae bacterium]
MIKTFVYAKSAVTLIAGILVFSLCFSFAVHAEPIIIDHTCTNIWQIPESAIEQAKADLHVAYGHTSHGSQITSGMGSNSGVSFDDFMTANGATPDLYLWNNGGSGGALDLHNYFMSGDLGNPDRYTWAQRTRDYLDDPANSDVNVIIWSWCGQANTTIANIDIYLGLMEDLISDYPNVNFVFMTGHLEGSGATGQLNLANEHIRNHCIANDRILYDFADIESYDPDGLVNYMELDANDDCSYDSDGDGYRESNWALDWQASHVEGVDWWASGASHSQHLNGNLKGYAAWWLWATLAGWNTTPCGPAPSGLNAALNLPETGIDLTWTDNSAGVNETEFVIQRQVNGGAWDNDYAQVAADVTQYTDTDISEGGYAYRVVAYYIGIPDNDPCYSTSSNVGTVQISTQAPQDPSNLASSLLAGAISLSWSDNSDNEESFVLERRTDSDAFIELAVLPAETTAYQDDTVAALHTYTYRVKAVNSSGDSGYSNEISEYVPEQTLSVTLKQGVDSYDGCTDTYLDESNPDTNYGATSYKTIGGDPQISYAVKFELPSNLMNKVIHDARLTLYCWSVSNYVSGSEFALHELTESWDENSATWNVRETSQSWSVAGGTYASPAVDTIPIQTSGFYPEFDITDIVQQWSDSSTANNGLILINDTLTLTGIKGSEYSEYGRPSLEIQYSSAPECIVDQDSDSDVDGLDLALFAISYDSDCLSAFAAQFGNE